MEREETELAVVRKIIIYACPTGELSEQLDRFYDRSRAEIGENAAHAYMPHSTLTGFFHDQKATIPFYGDLLDRLIAEALPSLIQPVIEIRGVRYTPEFHGLELESLWLKRLIREFQKRADSPTRADAIRPKDWLHLSLAYQFPPRPGGAAQSDGAGDGEPRRPGRLGSAPLRTPPGQPLGLPPRLAHF